MKKYQRLPDGELEIMQIIWKHEPPVSRSVIEKELNRDRKLAPSTIITFLSRLCDRGFLSVEHQGRTNLYTPRVSQKDYLACESRSFLDRLYGGSLSAFAASLCDSGISKEEIEHLRKLLEENLL
jgi:BlaI family penicillinase repressor